MTELLEKLGIHGSAFKSSLLIPCIVKPRQNSTGHRLPYTSRKQMTSIRTLTPNLFSMSSDASLVVIDAPSPPVLRVMENRQPTAS